MNKMTTFLKKNTKFINIGVLVISIVLMVLPCLAAKLFDTYSYKTSLFGGIFGFKDNNLQILRFNFVGLIILVLMLVSTILPLIDEKIKKFGYLISGIAQYALTLLFIFFPLIINRISSNTSLTFVGLPVVYVLAFLYLLIGNLNLLVKYID